MLPILRSSYRAAVLEDSNFYSDTDEKSSRIRWRYALFALAIFMTREVIGARTVLITPVPPFFTYTVCAIITIIYITLSIFYYTNKNSKFSHESNIILFVIIILFSLYLSRWVYELAAFREQNGFLQSEKFVITGVSPGTRSLGHRVHGKTTPEGREIDIFVTKDIHDELGAIRPPIWSLTSSDEQFCIVLLVEKGKWGTERAHIPALWDSGINKYESCRSS